MRKRRSRLFALATGCASLAVLVVVGVLARGARGASGWDPAAFAGQTTLELRTVGPEEGAYWFPVWLVVIDGQVYVRLGSRAANRVQDSTTSPYVGVKIAGQLFERVRAVPAPEDADRVAQAMARKYTSDLLVRWFPHPLTLRLVPE